MSHVLAIDEVLELFHDDVSCHEALELMEHLNSALLTAHEDQGEALMQAWELLCDLISKTLPLTEDHEGEWQYVGLDLLTEVRHLAMQGMVNVCEVCGSDMVSAPVVSLLLALASSLFCLPGTPAPQYRQTADDWARLVYALGAHQGQQGLPTGMSSPFGALLRAAFLSGPSTPVKAVTDPLLVPSTDVATVIRAPSGLWRLMSDERRGNVLESLWHAIRQQASKEDAAMLLLIHRQLLAHLAAGDLSADCCDALASVSAGFVSSQSCAAFGVTHAWADAQTPTTAPPPSLATDVTSGVAASAPASACVEPARRRSVSASRAPAPEPHGDGTGTRDRERNSLSAALLQRRNELRSILSEKTPSEVPSPLLSPPRASHLAVWPLQCLYHCVQDGCVYAWLKLLKGHCAARYGWPSEGCRPLLLSTFSQRAIIRSLTRIFLVVPSLLYPNLPRPPASRLPVWSPAASDAVRASCLSVIRCLITAATQAQAREAADARDADVPALTRVRVGGVGAAEEMGGEGGQQALLGDALHLLSVLQKAPLHGAQDIHSKARAS